MRPVAHQLCARFAAMCVVSRAAALALSVGAALAVAPIASADVKQVDPYFVAVNKDATPLKCLGGAPYYAVRLLKIGEVLRVDAEDGAWLRTEYLPGMAAFVKATEVTPETDGKTVRLTTPSRLAAINPVGNERGHWWYLLDEELPAGTALQLIESVKGVNGVVYGHYVTAPMKAHGWIKSDTTRKANGAEIADYRKARAESEAALAAATTPAPAAAEPASPELALAIETAGRLTAALNPATSNISPAIEAGVPAVPPTIYDVDTLRARFESAMAIKGDEAEAMVTTVAADFTRKIATLGDSAEDKVTRAVLEPRLKVLELRRDVLTAIKRAGRGEVASADGAGR